MALSGEIMKYVGNELMGNAGKELGTSALSSLVPKAVADTGIELATKSAIGSVVPKTVAKATLRSILPKTADDGMMTLYRGLTQEYDPKFPVARLDTSGYESWTDNPQLAKQYGDYVYSIDVPKKDIKTSYLDEDPKSLTYGDRNPIYSIEKKAGLNGVDGKEYLLEVGSDYQKGLNYNPVKFDNEVNMAIQNAGVDENAAMRAINYLNPKNVEGMLADQGGRPATLFHSTPNEFTKFDDSRLGENTDYSNTGFGHFVTTDKDFSSRFKDINNEGIPGRTMELRAKVKNPITHPYMAAQKYSDPAQLDRIVENYYKAIGADDSLETLREYAAEDGQSLYDEYMDMTVGEDPFESAADERLALMNNGYDGIEIVEGPKSGLVEGSNDNTPISSLAVFEGKNLSNINRIPISAIEGEGLDIPVSGSVLNKVAKYLKSPTDASGNPMMTKVMPEYTTIYHNTPLDNVDSIVKNGIKADAGARKYADKSEVGVWGSSVKGDGYGGSTIAFRMPADEAKKYMVNDTEYLIPRDIAPEDIVDVDRMLMSSGGATLRQSQIPEKIAKYGEDKVVEVMKRFGADDNTIKAMLGKNNKVSKYLEAPTDANADGVINWNDVKSIYAQAEKQQKVLDKMARSISEKEGYPEYQDFSPKSIESMENKVARKGGDYSLASMKDHTRNKIMMNSWNDVGKTINDIAEVFGGTPAVEYVVNDWGYKGLHITGRFDNGLGWEIQLTTPEDWPRKLKSDAIYDKWRNTQLDTASPKEVMGYLNAMRESKAMWSESKIPDLSMYDNVTGR